MKIKFQVVFFTLLLLGLAGCNGENPPTKKSAVEKLTSQVEPAVQEVTETTTGAQNLKIDDVIDIPGEEFVEETQEMIPDEQEISEMIPEDGEEVIEMVVDDEENGEDEEVLSDEASK
jgi:hypothetical protein